MKKNKDNELLTDDEIIRVQAFEDGDKEIGKWKLRPITALSISWMQRHNVFNDDKDMIWKASAFAFLHSVPFDEIRGCVKDKEAFIDAVDCWIESNIVHHSEIEGITTEMNHAFSIYTTSHSTQSKSKKGSSSNSALGN
jgi:hypothetical protein